MHDPTLPALDRRGYRSDRYQSLFAERACSESILQELAEQQLPPDDAEEIKELRDRLVMRMRELAEKHLTKQQWQVYRLILIERKTQVEVAKILGTWQSSVTKTLHGSAAYTPGAERKVYGGAIRKLRQICAFDPECREIICAIHAHYTDDPITWPEPPAKKIPQHTGRKVNRSGNDYSVIVLQALSATLEQATEQAQLCLRPKQKAIFDCLVVERLTAKNTADRLGMRTHVIYQTLHRQILPKMKKSLGKLSHNPRDAAEK